MILKWLTSIGMRLLRYLLMENSRSREVMEEKTDKKANRSRGVGQVIERGCYLQ